MLKSRKLLCVFVPRWGWVVSLHTNDFIKLDMFSSPSGDGLVLVAYIGNVRKWIFSSPLGDGLVLHGSK